METHVGDITHVIQLAVAPVFLLTAIAALITTLNVRLGRIVDRMRAILDQSKLIPEDPPDEVKGELNRLSRRIRIMYSAIFSAVAAGLMVCLVVAGGFVGALLAIDLAKAIAVVFILAMCALIICLGLFLREIYLAVITGPHRDHAQSRD